jgi:hypothetical protein
MLEIGELLYKREGFMGTGALLTEKELDAAIEAAEKWPLGTDSGHWVTAEDPTVLDALSCGMVDQEADQVRGFATIKGFGPGGKSLFTALDDIVTTLNLDQGMYCSTLSLVPESIAARLKVRKQELYGEKNNGT